jgi:hypothetical protein
MRNFLTILLLIVSATVYSQSSRTVSGIDTIVGNDGYEFTPYTNTWDITVEDSRFRDTISGGRLLQCGSDSYNASTANNYDGAVIEGNQFISDTIDDGLHGILNGYNKNQKLRWNYRGNLW